MDPEIVGAVLVGGDSRRMGRDKARLEIEGETLALRAARTLAGVCGDTVLVGSADGRPLGLGFPEIRDRSANQGPLAGLEAALYWAAPRAVFVLACDLPRVDAAVVRRILQAARGRGGAAEAWVAERDGRRQPLCALYAAASRSAVARRLRRGERSMHGLLDELATTAVRFDDLEPDPLLNLNTPGDLVAADGADTVSA